MIPRLLGVALAAALGLPAAAVATTSQEAVALLDVQRAANGIPADVAYSPELTIGCQKHNEYMAFHGMKHREAEGEQGYSPEGAGDGPYGGSEVLASMGAWSQTSHPWVGAPIHEYLMFDPAVTLSGYDESRYQCMRMRGGRTASTPSFYAYTGPQGRVGVPYAERAAELPYIPQQLVGIPDDQKTGPNLLLFSLGFGRQLEPQEASLVGPDGPVDIRMVVESSHNEIGDGSWFSGGGVMIPVAPLRPFATYTARVLWRNPDGALAEQSFSFETAGRPLFLSVDAEDHGHGRLWVTVNSDAPNVAVERHRPGGQPQPIAYRNHSMTVPVAPGVWEVCASAGGRQTGYQPARECATATVTASAKLKLARKPAGRKVLLVAERALVGQRATVSIRRWAKKCFTVPGYGRLCGPAPVGKTTKRTVRLRSRQRLRLPKARRGSSFQLTITLKRFQRSSVPYRSTKASRRYR
jgi:hypothetical protein